jgi:RNA polymerase sigma-70 factor (ECF subfamily)
MAIQRIDAPSIVELFDRLADGIYTLAVRVVGDRHLGEDVVQETFLLALRKLHTWRGDGSIDGWIYRIGYRQAIAALRRRRDHPVDPVDLPDAVDSQSDPERDVLRAELARRVDAAIVSLPPMLRAAYVLRDIEGLSTGDVAAALDLSESAVKMRLKRARMTLRDELKGYL